MILPVYAEADLDEIEKLAEDIKAAFPTELWVRWEKIMGGAKHDVPETDDFWTVCMYLCRVAFLFSKKRGKADDALLKFIQDISIQVKSFAIRRNSRQIDEIKLNFIFHLKNIYQEVSRNKINEKTGRTQLRELLQGTCKESDLNWHINKMAKGFNKKDYTNGPQETAAEFGGGYFMQATKTFHNMRKRINVASDLAEQKINEVSFTKMFLEHSAQYFKGQPPLFADTVGSIRSESFKKLHQFADFFGKIRAMETVRSSAASAEMQASSKKRKINTPKKPFKNVVKKR